MVNAFVSGAVTVQINTPPLNQSPIDLHPFTAKGFDTSGNPYIYYTGNIYRRTYQLSFPRITDVLLAALRSFFTDTVDGTKTAFTWYDHLGATHTVKFSTPELKHTRQSVNRHKVDISLEEDLPITLPAIAGWTTAMQMKVGSAPVWILRLTINGTDYFLSSSTFNLPSTSIVVESPGWPTGAAITTLPWIGKWGSVTTQITGDLNEYSISDFNCDVLNDPNVSPDIRVLVQAYPVEQYPAELYLWFLGLNAATDPPRLMLRGYVDEVNNVSAQGVSFVIKDESSRLQNYVGTKVDLTTYPDADPDDVGKVIPIVFGTVEKVPALAIVAGRVTTLPYAISAAATSVQVSDVSGLSVGGTVQADSEQMHITGINGSTLTVTRGYNSTLAATHLVGAVVWEVLPKFVYMLADHPVSSINKIYGQVGQGLLNITPICTLYTGASGQQHSSYPGKAVVTIPNQITVAQAVSLYVNDGNVSYNSNVSLDDRISLLKDFTLTNGNLSLNDGIHVYDVISVSAPSMTDNTHNHSNPGSISEVATNCPVSTDNYIAVITFLSQEYWPVSSVTYSITVMKRIFISGGTYGLSFVIGGNTVFTDTTIFPTIAAGTSITYEFATSVFPVGTTNNNVTLSVSTPGVNGYATAMSASRQVSYTGLTTSSVTNDFVYGGGRDATHVDLSSGTVTINGQVAYLGNIMNKQGTVSVSSATVSKSGSLIISGNSVANTMIAEVILADITSAYGTPQSACQFLLNHYTTFSSLTVQQSGTFPNSYGINGIIDRYETALYWLTFIAFQCRAWWRLERGTATLTVRPDSPSSMRTLAACLLDSSNLPSLTQSKVQYTKVLNKISLLFDRDWTQSRGDTAFKDNYPDSRTASITNYGVRENPTLFQFDFVTSQTMAANLAEFYLNTYAVRRWVSEFREFLDQCDLRFGNAVTLGFHNNNVVEITGVEIDPGGGSNIDNVKIIGEGFM